MARTARAVAFCGAPRRLARNPAACLARYALVRGPGPRASARREIRGVMVDRGLAAEPMLARFGGRRTRRSFGQRSFRLNRERRGRSLVGEVGDRLLNGRVGLGLTRKNLGVGPLNLRRLAAR